MYIWRKVKWMNLLVSISRNIYSLDKSSMDKVEERWKNLLYKERGLGGLEDITKLLAGVHGSSKIEDNIKKCMIVFAADHGVVEEGVSSKKKLSTKVQFDDFVEEKSVANSIARFNRVDTFAVDMGIDREEINKDALNYRIANGTKNMSKQQAMSIDQAVKAIENGIEVAEKYIVDGYQVIGVGDLGAGNTTSATAIVSVMSGKDPIDIMMGRDDHKAEVIRRSIEINNPNPTDGIEVLSKVGGFEIGGIVGVILGCAANRIPIVLDGYISYAAALIAYRINPKSKEYIILSHKSSEVGSETALELLNMKPILDLDINMGEGVGTILAMNIIDSAIYAYNKI